MFDNYKVSKAQYKKLNSWISRYFRLGARYGHPGHQIFIRISSS